MLKSILKAQSIRKIAVEALYLYIDTDIKAVCTFLAFLYYLMMHQEKNPQLLSLSKTFSVYAFCWSYYKKLTDRLYW